MGTFLYSRAACVMSCHDRRDGFGRFRFNTPPLRSPEIAKVVQSTERLRIVLGIAYSTTAHTPIVHLDAVTRAGQLFVQCCTMPHFHSQER